MSTSSQTPEHSPIVLALRCGDKLVRGELNFDDIRIRHVLGVDRKVTTVALGDKLVGSWWLRGLPAREGDNFISNDIAGLFLNEVWQKHSGYQDLQGGGIFELVRLVAIGGQMDAEKQLRRVFGLLFPNAIFYNPREIDTLLGTRIWDPADESVDKLGLSIPLSKALQEACIGSVADLLQFSRRELIEMPGIGVGKRAADGIEEVLASRGLRLAVAPADGQQVTPAEAELAAGAITG